VMDKKLVLLAGIVVVCVVIIGVLAVMYSGVVSEVVMVTADLDDARLMMDSLNTSIVALSEDLNESENFIDLYFTSWGLFYEAEDAMDQAQFNYDKADGYYTVGNWFNSVGYYDEASDFYWGARDAYRLAYESFYSVSNLSSDETISLVCLGYRNMSECMMRAMTFYAEASDLLENVCDFYLDGKYDDAHDTFDDAQVKLGFVSEQLTLYDVYLDNVKGLLLEY